MDNILAMIDAEIAKLTHVRALLNHNRYISQSDLDIVIQLAMNEDAVKGTESLSDQVWIAVHRQNASA